MGHHKDNEMTKLNTEELHSLKITHHLNINLWNNYQDLKRLYQLDQDFITRVQGTTYTRPCFLSYDMYIHLYSDCLRPTIKLNKRHINQPEGRMNDTQTSQVCSQNGSIALNTTICRIVIFQNSFQLFGFQRQ